jgi:hypothetical protein
MYKDANHDFRSTEEFKAAQRANMEDGKNLELKSETFVADKKELERLRGTVQARDMPNEEKSRALAYLDEQARVLEATWEKDVERPESEEQAELSAEYRRQLDEMDNFNNLRKRSMAQHRQVVAM